MIKIKPFRKLVMSVDYSTSRDKFVRMCSDWSLFNLTLSRLDKYTLLKLIHYLVEERPNSNRLLDRTISRFNRLNALKRKDLGC